MSISSCRLALVFCGLFTITATGSAHDYQTCMQELAAHCPGPPEDPLNICVAQAAAYCGNHDHGGGGTGGAGVGLPEPIFAIEDDDDFLILTTKIDLSVVDKRRRRAIAEAIRLGAEEMQVKQKSTEARLRLLLEEGGQEGEENTNQ